MKASAVCSDMLCSLCMSYVPEGLFTLHVCKAKTEPAGGDKKDAGKLPLELLPVDALEEIAKVLQFGAQKYAARNWEQGISYGRVYGAALRHLFAWWRGENLDPETGLHHLAHACCECMFALAFALRKMRSFDDRPVGDEFK